MVDFNQFIAVEMDRGASSWEISKFDADADLVEVGGGGGEDNSGSR